MFATDCFHFAATERDSKPENRVSANGYSFSKREYCTQRVATGDPSRWSAPRQSHLRHLIAAPFFGCFTGTPG
jgi:hypothetical protein